MTNSGTFMGPDSSKLPGILQKEENEVGIEF